MVTLSELQMKEVIMMHNGKRLGFIDDLEIDEKSGLITAIIIVERQMRGSFFQKPTERSISWDQIVTIGADIILVSEWEEVQKQPTEIPTSE
ncbi:YlmC/YmxH family sporulation protein [Pseudogracilibacillus auburnensis]|uniref:YlmC/YmxH family sporulation protein n=1 Tax=Pseudogracilibacillus auburnensis TaxID=1494959 RepID=A0A2V3WIA7_9BACI|nr:YlmC/YmxH family sporulation protein [Pseudogracilibacillus auburnensis]MBO1005523.1 YlmC/YmxH family sporulation protein [Pseudogracilibacillus auburnensis]PXW88529.1 YlmC/YmxH family sporulation protein [Pseudogracilibacillus auburnensis]